MNGIQLTSHACRKYKNSGLILTTFDDHNMLLEALKAGREGTKDVELEMLVSGIERIVGESMIQPTITTSLLNGLQDIPNLRPLPRPRRFAKS